jgi:hypothetical protein
LLTEAEKEHAVRSWLHARGSRKEERKKAEAGGAREKTMRIEYKVGEK